MTWSRESPSPYLDGPFSLILKSQALANSMSCGFQVTRFDLFWLVLSCKGEERRDAHINQRVIRPSKRISDCPTFSLHGLPSAPESSRFPKPCACQHETARPWHSPAMPKRRTFHPRSVRT